MTPVLWTECEDNFGIADLDRRLHHGGGRRELLKRPKVYGFDTGFVTYARGWKDIRDDDRELLWEHLVLDTLRTATGGEGLFHWRDKSGFVPEPRGPLIGDDDGCMAKITPSFHLSG